MVQVKKQSNRGFGVLYLSHVLYFSLFRLKANYISAGLSVLIMLFMKKEVNFEVSYILTCATFLLTVVLQV